MAAGGLDRQVQLQSFSATRVDGEDIRTWSTWASPWAWRIDETGREFFAAEGKRAEAKAVFRIRWRAGVTRQMRVVDGGEVWDIASIVQVGRNRWLDLMCAAIVE